MLPKNKLRVRINIIYFKINKSIIHHLYSWLDLLLEDFFKPFYEVFLIFLNPWGFGVNHPLIHGCTSDNKCCNMILTRLWTNIWKDKDNAIKNKEPDKVSTNNEMLPLNKSPPKNIDHLLFISGGRIQLADLHHSSPQTKQGRRRARSVYPRLMKCYMVLFDGRSVPPKQTLHGDQWPLTSSVRAGQHLFGGAAAAVEKGGREVDGWCRFT